MISEPASPVCYAAQAYDAYMGYATPNELAAALNELLEAERAGAKVALATAKAATDPSIAQLMQAMRADEAHWSAMLSRQLRLRVRAASRKTGAFYGKAMAIADLRERMALLNRGQSWVVRKLEMLMPRVRDEQLHADLRRMLESHRDNIDRIDAVLRVGVSVEQNNCSD